MTSIECKNCGDEFDPKEVARVYGEGLVERGFCTSRCYTRLTTATENLRPVQFCFDEVGPFDGWTDGTTWNGWLNVWTTPETHKKIVAQFEVWRQASNLPQCEEDLEFDNLEPGEDGLVSYAMGYTTSEWPTDDPTPYQKWVDGKHQTNDLGELVDEMKGREGFIYPDGSWIEAVKNEGHGWTFSTIVGNQEFSFDSLGAVEWWLWKNWAESQQQLETDYDPAPPTEDKPLSFEDVLRTAHEAFWASVANSYPTAKTGDFPPDASMKFDEACRDALQTWITYNVDSGPDCGHSACSQNYIDTGSTECVEGQ